MNEEKISIKINMGVLFALEMIAVVANAIGLLLTNEVGFLVLMLFSLIVYIFTIVYNNVLWIQGKKKNGVG